MGPSDIFFSFYVSISIDALIVQGLFMQGQFWEGQSHSRHLGMLALTTFLSLLP